MRSLAERLKAYEQQKARLAQTEAKLKAAEKAAHIRRLIQSGRLMERAGLDPLSPEALYGALLTLRPSCEDTKKVEQWTVAGARAMAEEVNDELNTSSPIVLTFPTTMRGEAAEMLRAQGFRFNRLLKHWEGLGKLDQALTLAELHGGEARTLGNTALTD